MESRTGIMIKEILKSNKFINNLYIKIKWRERDISRGAEYPDKKFYIIRRHSREAGLFSFFITNLGSIVKAVDEGYIPVIDMMNYPNSLIPESMVGKHNAWDDYFFQPSDYSMEDIARAKNIRLGSINAPEEYPDYNIFNNKEKMELWRRYSKEFMMVLPEHISSAESYIEDKFKGRRILGVLIRGTDYKNKRPSGHPIQPSIDMVIDRCRQVLKQKKCEYIYLATEDEEAYRDLSEAFPGKVFSYQKNRYHITGEEYLSDQLNKNLIEHKADPDEIQKAIYERNRQYLVSLIVLSKCTCLVAGATSGTIGTVLLSEGYEYQEIIDLGNYT